MEKGVQRVTTNNNGNSSEVSRQLELPLFGTPGFGGGALRELTM